MERHDDGISYEDANGRRLRLGSRVFGGGEVAGFSAPDMSCGGVHVRWDGEGGAEYFGARMTEDERHVVDELEALEPPRDTRADVERRKLAHNARLRAGGR